MPAVRREDERALLETLRARFPHLDHRQAMILLIRHKWNAEAAVRDHLDQLARRPAGGQRPAIPTVAPAASQDPLIARLLSCFQRAVTLKPFAEAAEQTLAEAEEQEKATSKELEDAGKSLTHLSRSVAFAAPEMVVYGRLFVVQTEPEEDYHTRGETFTFVTNDGLDSKLDLFIVGRASACLVYPECAFQGQLCTPLNLPIRVGPFVTDVYCSGEARESADLIVVRLDRKAFEAEWDAQCADGGSVGIAAKNQDFDAWLQSLPSIAAPMPLSEASEVEVLVGQGAAAAWSGHHPRLADEARHKECTATPSALVLKYVLHHGGYSDKPTLPSLRFGAGTLMFPLKADSADVDVCHPIGVHGAAFDVTHGRHAALRGSCALLHNWKQRLPRHTPMSFVATKEDDEYIEFGGGVFEKVTSKGANSTAWYAPRVCWVFVSGKFSMYGRPRDEWFDTPPSGAVSDHVVPASASTSEL